jgi:hypothetical protein
VSASHELRVKRLASFVERAQAAGLRLDRAVGGYNAHALDRQADDGKALCGFEPSNAEGSSMEGTSRGSWRGSCAGAIRRCPRCEPKVAARFAEAAAACSCDDVDCRACGPRKRAL